jgi:hypothetical protein
MIALSISRSLAAAVLVGTVSVAATAAPAPAPMTTEQFVTRCKTDARFCKTQILAAHALLERSRKACLPAGLTKNAMAERVADTVADVLEEDPDSFRNQPYRQVVDQLILYLWPCEPIS